MIQLGTQTLSNGTRIIVGKDWVYTVLPNGKLVEAEANDETPEMAEKLGYGSDLAACTREHDPLHAKLTDMLGLPYSISLMQVASEDVPADLASLEEQIVLDAQRLLNGWRKWYSEQEE